VNPAETGMIVVFVTAPSQEHAEAVARKLVEERLAACVNIVAPIRSIYTWEGKTVDDQEILLLVKTRAELFTDRLVPAIRSIHPYQVPEIIALPILAGSPDYLNWIQSVTLPAGDDHDL